MLLSLPPDSKSVERRSSPDLNLSAGRAQQRPNPPPPAMTTLAKLLLAQKQEIIARLQQEDTSSEERDEIERLLEKIEAALDLLDEAGPSGL